MPRPAGAESMGPYRPRCLIFQVDIVPFRTDKAGEGGITRKMVFSSGSNVRCANRQQLTLRGVLIDSCAFLASEEFRVVFFPERKSPTPKANIQGPAPSP